MKIYNVKSNVVQHYGYTAFGHERYKHNTAAFDVTNRYTGQQIDEETGLYFYQSRYYDAELGRFTQADTIVPSANTSQALNRYAYVKNNPLKFTDPSGHGWFSKVWKAIKPFIGTIISIGLNILVPGLGLALCGLIGGAIGGAINGGTWKSIFIGAAIGMVAGTIANGIGGHFGGGVDAFKAWAGSGIGAFVAGALTGAVSGAISSAVYGGNWGKNMLAGAKAGIIGVAQSMTFGKILTVTKKLVIVGINATKELIAWIGDTFNKIGYEIAKWRCGEGQVPYGGAVRPLNDKFSGLQRAIVGLLYPILGHRSARFSDGTGTGYYPNPSAKDYLKAGFPQEVAERNAGRWWPRDENKMQKQGLIFWRPESETFVEQLKFNMTQHYDIAPGPTQEINCGTILKGLEKKSRREAGLIDTGLQLIENDLLN